MKATKADTPIHFKETEYGFEYGAAHIERCMSDNKKGWVILSLTTARGVLHLYITKTGKVRVWNAKAAGHEWKDQMKFAKKQYRAKRGSKTRPNP
jgi:hypothetical protein